MRAVRMHKADGDIVQLTDSIADIGRAVSYPSVETFAQAFSAHINQSPASYSREARLPIIKLFDNVVVVEDGSNDSQVDFQISIRLLLRNLLVDIWHQGNYLTVGRSFAKVFASPPISVSNDVKLVGVGVYFQDPPRR